MADLTALLNNSKSLISHLPKSDLPSVSLSLDQIEAQSRRLVSRQPASSTDLDRGNFLLARAHIDAPALSSSIAHLNTATTFTPLQALQDTDVAGYLRHAHEQNLISTIEEGRKETQDDFYRVLEERSQKDWEAKKKRVFEELGARVGGTNMGAVDFRKSTHGKNSLLGVSVSRAPVISPQMQNKMVAYKRIVTDLNTARLKGSSYPILHSLIDACVSLSDPRGHETTQALHILAKITDEPPPIEDAGENIINAPPFERKYARAHLGDQDSPDAATLRKQIARGAREALEEQYWDILDTTVQTRQTEAKLGGDPSICNRVRAFLAVRFYSNGEWEDRIELVAGQPMWAKLFFLVRTGHTHEALQEAIQNQGIIGRKEVNFINYFKTWIESPERKLSKAQRSHLQVVYNAYMLHSSVVDPYKIALYKLMGRIEPSRRNVPHVTTTAEDWLWFQLMMIDEDEDGGLRVFGEVLLNYGERHFDGAPGQRGRRMWPIVLLICGQFERAVAALWENSETEIEAIHLAIALAYYGLLRVPPRSETSDVTPLSFSSGSPPALSLSTLVWRYIRQFVKLDAKEALQYVYTVCLSADQGDVGKEQVEIAWELVRRILVLADSGPVWEELVGGFRGDGSRFSGLIEQNARLLRLTEVQQYNEHILLRAARRSEENDRISEAIKLFNLAGDYATVVSCLAIALGNILANSGPDEKAHSIQRTAKEILHHYERTNKVVGRNYDAASNLLRIREAMEAKENGDLEIALGLLENTNLVPLAEDTMKIAKKVEEFKDLHESVQRNLPVYLLLTMRTLAEVYDKVKNSTVADATKQKTIASIRKKSRSVMVFAGLLKYRMSPDVYSNLARLDVEIAL